MLWLVPISNPKSAREHLQAPLPLAAPGLGPVLRFQLSAFSIWLRSPGVTATSCTQARTPHEPAYPPTSCIDWRLRKPYIPGMSTVAEIEAALPKLTAPELAQIERALHNQYRQRGGGIVYDDDYGTVTEADLIASADEAFQAYDRAEAEPAKRQPR